MTVSPKRQPFSIRIFLADGTPDGLRIVEKTNWTGVGLMFSRVQYADVQERDFFSRPGVYILVGPSESGAARQRIYVGEAEELRVRLRQHATGKDFWTRAIAFASSDDYLNKAHVRFLESRLVERAHDARRADVENGNAPQRPRLSEPETAYAEAFLADMLLIFPLLGVEAFEVAAAARSDPRPRLHLVGRDARAQGLDTPEGFVVLAGARVRRQPVPSLHGYVIELRDKLLADGVLEDRGDHLSLVRDHVFDSPSGAACVVLGRSSNGRVEWKDAEGQSLKQLQEAAVGS